MDNIIAIRDVVNFGELSPEINALLQQGVVAYRSDRAKADQLFKEALARTPQELPPYYCLYKIHTYMGSLDYAAEVAALGMKEAARQAGWTEDPRAWPAPADAQDGPARFALYTLKALSFIELKRGDRAKSDEYLQILSETDPQGSVGWKVIQELSSGIVR
jgi:hypothetical protein